MKRPNILFVMCDQLRADSVGFAGNSNVKTPNIDRLAQNGVVFNNAYSTCPVCIPARYTIRTGREPYNTGFYCNSDLPVLTENQEESIEKRCGKYLARTLNSVGYRTFGIGKFDTTPAWNEDIGYEKQLHSLEVYYNQEQRIKDDYSAFINKHYPEFTFIEQYHGERTDMYYVPQVSPLPAEITVESWVADRAIEQINGDDGRPYYGLVSFIGPHPPFAPPIPYNRMYNPDDMPEPVCGEISTDHMDEQLPYMNHAVFAEDICPSLAKKLKARYYGEITYIDKCIGRILDAIEENGDLRNTLICFFSDHGDLLGDHHAWQKESFFESACKIPFIISWPDQLRDVEKSEELVCLTDLFGIATSAAGCTQLRDGVDILKGIHDNTANRQILYGYYGTPGTRNFKIMAREKEWKYIYMANGGREQLFNIKEDPEELNQSLDKFPHIAKRMREAVLEEVKKRPALLEAIEGNKLKKCEFGVMRKERIYQFDRSKGIRGFSI